MNIAVIYHNNTTKPIMSPILRSDFRGVRWRRKANKDNFAKVILVIKRKLAAYCA